MGIIHCHIFRLNANILAIDWASNSIAQLYHPGILGECWLCELRDQNTVVSTGLDATERLHVFYRLFVDFGVTESNAHVGSFRLTVSEDDSVVEERPHVFGLDVGEQDIGINGKDDS